MKHPQKPRFGKGWCFAIMNGRLAEIFFEPKGIWGHCYVKRKEYTKTEQRMIEADIKKYRFSYRKNYYKDLDLGTVQKVIRPQWLKRAHSKKWLSGKKLRELI